MPRLITGVPGLIANPSAAAALSPVPQATGIPSLSPVQSAADLIKLPAGSFGSRTLGRTDCFKLTNG